MAAMRPVTRGIALSVTALTALTLVAASADLAAAPPQTAPPAASAVAQEGFGADGAGDTYYPADGNGGYDVAGYAVSVTVDPVAGHLDGEAVITARATEPLRRFNLDLHGLEVRQVSVGDRPAVFERSGQHELVITPASPVAAGATFTTTVRYDGEPTTLRHPLLGETGWRRSDSGGIFVAGEPHSASTWYPVNDTPRDKATFQLSVTVPDGWGVVSVGREQPPTPATRPGWTTWRWTENVPLASYLTTVGIDRWTFDRGTLADGTPVVTAYAPGTEGQRVTARRLPEILDFLASKFGPYPVDAAGAIYLADPIGFSLETQTRPIYSRGVPLSTVVHENAHQWFGDSVSVDNWRDICLNECFASYAQWLWSETKEGENLDTTYRSQLTRRQDNTLFWQGRLYDMGPGLEFTAVYTKGALALHALRRTVGDEVFFRILRTWTAAHRDGNASWPEFERHAAQTAGQDLTGFFQAWFHGTTIPAREYLFPGSLSR
jgi:aminopeptidase N